MVTVAVTGASGLIGSRLVPLLQAHPDVDEVVAVDLVAPEGLDVAFRRADVTDLDAVTKALAGVDVVVHLAARFEAGRDVEGIRAVNVGGTHTVAEAAVAVGARKLVLTSSASAYGAHPDNALPLTEEAPLRANPGLPYAEHKREIDRWSEEFAAAHPELVVTVLRPAIVTGAGVDNFAVRALLGPRLPVIKGHRPPLQFVHVDDVAAAFVHVVVHDLPGAFNVAAEGWLSLDEVAAILGRKWVEVPEEVAITVAERTHALGLAEIPPGTVHYFMHPWVLSVDKLVATGWQPEHTNRDALATLAAEHRDDIALGRYVADRRQVRTAATAAGVAGGVLALGVVSRWAWKRRSS